MDRCHAENVKIICGDVLRMGQPFAPKSRYTTSTNQTAVRKCLLGLLYKLDDIKEKLDCNCLLPCHRDQFIATRIPHPTANDELMNQNQNLTWKIELHFKDDTVKVLREYPLYNAEQLISQVGGICGLFLGMSLLSISELLIYGILSIARRCVN